jgi:hypothetical protein
VFSLLYIALTAKAVSVRRLCIIYAFVFVLTSGMLGLLSVRPVAHIASVAATVSVLLIWSSPLVRTIWAGLEAGSARPAYLSATSVSVQFTYGVALVVIPLIAMATVHPSAIHPMAMSTLSRVVILAVVAGLCFPLAVQRLCRVPHRVVCTASAVRQTPCRIASDRR